MASNPFFSGRIPTELYQQAENHCKETGDSKTELLIKALSAYLNFPVAIPGNTFMTSTIEVTKEMFDNLQERIKLLEELLKPSNSNVITNDNIDNYKLKTENNSNDNNLELTDNNIDNSEDKEDVIKHDNELDNEKLEIKTDEQATCVGDLSKVEFEISEGTTELPRFEEIITAEVVKKSNLKRNQVEWLMSKAIEKIKQQGKIIEPAKLLEEPIEVFHKQGIEVDGQPYRLFYCGENFKERPVWNLIHDNNSYQTVITTLAYSDSKADNTGYQSDNKGKTSRKTSKKVHSNRKPKISDNQLTHDNSSYQDDNSKPVIEENIDVNSEFLHETQEGSLPIERKPKSLDSNLSIENTSGIVGAEENNQNTQLPY
jgi:hypothetical protein